MNLVKPEAAYIKAGTRTAGLVADLNEAQMTELGLLASKKMGTYAKFIPLIRAAAIPEMVGEMLQKM
jgi:hypothetical protein